MMGHGILGMVHHPSSNSAHWAAECVSTQSLQWNYSLVFFSFSYWDLY